jgi:hypothetical protein
MFRIPDIAKVYLFVLLGVGIGYLGSFDHKNFFILGVPSILLIKNTHFNCYEDKIKFERQKSINHVLHLIRESIDLVKTVNVNSMEEAKEKIQSILKSFMGGLDLQSVISTGIYSFISS